MVLKLHVMLCLPYTVGTQRSEDSTLLPNNARYTIDDQSFIFEWMSLQKVNKFI